MVELLACIETAHSQFPSIPGRRATLTITALFIIFSYWSLLWCELYAARIVILLCFCTELPTLRSLLR